MDRTFRNGNVTAGQTEGRTRAGDARTAEITVMSTQEAVAPATSAPENASSGPSNAETMLRSQPAEPQQVVMDEDPLLIAQTLTYVTDDGSVLQSFATAPFSWSFKLRFILLEAIFVLLLVAAVPIGAHGTVVSVSIGNLFAVGWFWYNLVRGVDVTAEGALRFWIGNIEIDVPFDKIVSMRRVAITSPCGIVSCSPHRGFLSTPTDGVCIVTTVPSTPFWMWPRSAGKPDRTCCFGILSCPRLTIVFSPAVGSLNFIREVENEMRSFSNTPSTKTQTLGGTNSSGGVGSATQDFLDV